MKKESEVLSDIRGVRADMDSIKARVQDILDNAPVNLELPGVVIANMELAIIHINCVELDLDDAIFDIENDLLLAESV